MLSKLFGAAMLLAPLALAAPLPAQQPSFEIFEYNTRDLDGLHEPMSADDLKTLAPRDADEKGWHPICKKGIRVFGVRGSGAPLFTGALALVADQVANLKPDSLAGDLPYPATTDYYNPAAVANSIGTGIDLLTYRVQHYIDACDGPVVLMGYSQGAWIVGDVLIGQSGTVGQGLPQKYRDRINAIVTMGDPAFIPGQPYDVGTASNHGVAARDNFWQYESYGLAGKMQTYCDADDFCCASGSSGLGKQSPPQPHTHAADILIFMLQCTRATLPTTAHR